MDAHAQPEPSVAETLPASYRRVLDRVADLESAGFRREADLLRQEATAAYSKRWNERTGRRLERLAIRATRVLDGRERPRQRALSRRDEVARWLGHAPARARRRLAGGGQPSSARPGGMTTERPTA